MERRPGVITVTLTQVNLRLCVCGALNTCRLTGIQELVYELPVTSLQNSVDEPGRASCDHCTQHPYSCSWLPLSHFSASRSISSQTYPDKHCCVLQTHHEVSMLLQTEGW